MQSEKASFIRQQLEKGNLDDVTQWLLMVVQAGDSSTLEKALEVLERFPAVDDYLEKRVSETYRPSTSSSYGPIRSVQYIINRPLQYTSPHCQTYATYLLCEACKRNCSEIVKLLIRSGAAVNVMDGKFGTPLQNVAKTGNLDIAKLLILKHRADLKVVNEHHKTVRTQCSSASVPIISFFFMFQLRDSNQKNITHSHHSRISPLEKNPRSNENSIMTPHHFIFFHVSIT